MLDLVRSLAEPINLESCAFGIKKLPSFGFGVRFADFRRTRISMSSTILGPNVLRSHLVILRPEAAK